MLLVCRTLSPLLKYTKCKVRARICWAFFVFSEGKSTKPNDMNTKFFNTLFIGLPMIGIVLFTSCSEDKKDSEGAKTEKKESEKPLLERNADVKEYFEVLNKMINEYISVGETTLDIVEKLEHGKLGIMDAAVASGELVESMAQIEELNQSLAQQGTIKENVEAKLNAKDLAKFNAMYSESLARMDTLSKRLDSLDLNSYSSELMNMFE